ncbi:MAG: cytochrome c oxidase subunit 3 [Planctomycetota bacterium]
MRDTSIEVDKYEADPSREFDLHYQPLLSLTNSRLAMLLFLSTEVMFFIALLGSYLVLRYSEPVWPSTEVMHVDWMLGVFNTLILFGSTLTLGIAIRSARKDLSAASKFWLLATILLAIVFIGVKSSEYYEKYNAGFLTRYHGGLVFDVADENYLSKTAAAMNSHIDAASGQAIEDGDVFELIRSGLIEWTQYKVGRTADRETKQSAIEAMAYQIYRIEQSSDIDAYLALETEQVERDRELLDLDLGQLKSSLRQTQNQIEVLIPELEKNDVDATENYARLSSQADVQTNAIEAARKQMTPLDNRLELGDRLASSAGVNTKFGLRLPMVIPGGKTWVNTYLLLTVFHLVHLVVGLGILLVWVTIQFKQFNVHWLENFSLYWHFVDVVWLIILAVVYFS